MNISITNLCNRRCSYCFQKQWYLSNKAYFDDSVKEMSLEMLEDVLHWASIGLKKDSAISIMGGEPLMHSRIFEIFDLINKLKINTCFISNISIPTESFKRLLEKDLTYIKSFLINTDFPESQKDLFYDNFALLCEKKQTISISSTIFANDEEIEKSINRLLTCLEIYRQIVGDDKEIAVRLSPYCPLNALDNQYKLVNYTYAIVNIINMLLFYHPNLRIGLDCVLDEEELSEESAKALRDGGVDAKIKPCQGTGGAFDVLYNGSIVWCSSCNDIKLDSYKNYASHKEAKEALNAIYDEKSRGFGKFKCLAKARNKNVISIKSAV